MKNSGFIKATTVAFSLIWSLSASATLITNGGFETGDLTGWTCTGADSCIVTSSEPHSGTFNMQGFDNSGFATLSQTIATVMGATYDFSFWSFTNVLDPANILRYSIGGGAPVLVAQTGTTAAAYAMTSVSFMASGASTDIDFFFETDSGTGTWKIDDVSVTVAAVPEPATLALMGLGLAGIGYSRKRKTA